MQQRFLSNDLFFDPHNTSISDLNRNTFSGTVLSVLGETLSQTVVELRRNETKETEDIFNIWM